MVLEVCYIKPVGCSAALVNCLLGGELREVLELLEAEEGAEPWNSRAPSNAEAMRRGEV